MANNQSGGAARHFWDSAAATFDNEPDHGLREPVVRQAWRDLLLPWLPPAPAAILDIGCGTGSLSVLAAELGHQVTGIDFAPAMVAQAQAKAQAAGHAISFHVMDAAQPHLPTHAFTLILCRHLLWALPTIDQVLQRWTTLLAPAGRLLLIEGYWHTGGGLHAPEIVAALPSSLVNVIVQPLSDRPILWGGTVTDERYLIAADRPPTND